jgi:hypothetical protein
VKGGGANKVQNCLSSMQKRGNRPKFNSLSLS